MINKDSIENILISRTDRLGDVILTLPLITETKRIFKNSKIFFLVKGDLKELIKNYEGIDEYLTEETIPGFWNKYNCLKMKKIDLVINVKPRFDLALLFFLLRIKYRIGIAYRWYSFLYNHKVYEHRKISDKHESDYNLNLLKYFFTEVTNEKVFHFKYSEEEKMDLNKKLNSLLNDKYIIIHPGSGGSSFDLPLEKFSEYINKTLIEFDEYKIILTGIERERELLNTLQNSVKDNFKNKILEVSGKLNLKELLILIDNSKLFISNSTGPIHIAGALNKNIIGFYPNKLPMGDVRWKPLSSNLIILKPTNKSDDMSSIEVDEIINATRNFLGNKTCLN